MTGVSSDRWRVLSPLLDEALELASHERTGWLAAIEEKDVVLAADLRAMLLEHEALDARGFLKDGVLKRSPGTTDPVTVTTASSVNVDRAGMTIGPYRLVRELGAGGMGVVWLAEQERPIHRTVAIKMVRPGIDSRQVLARFDAERQALAILNHPGIARVFDAGATSDGRPYFVMEYIAGLPITAFADQRELPIAERLELFLQVCDAVHHAHQKRVLHRDLKPRNILVSEEDGRCSVKVIDFGIAKALGHRLTGETVQTEFGAVVGTPEYMSPEQAGLVDAPVDTRSDIYSLGLILYELLSGLPPFHDPETTQRMLLPALRAIRDSEPPLLTARLTEHGDAFVRQVARQRRTEPRALVRQLRDELERITRRAIESEPEQRYPSVSDFRADIDRHQKGQPVLAGAPSTIYRLRKLARRNGPFAAAVGLIAVAVGIIAVISTLALVRAFRTGDVMTGADPGSMPLPLTSFPGIEAKAAWSPDGRRVAFIWNGQQQKDFHIYSLQAGSSQPVRLTMDAGSDDDPAWSPDGRFIAYIHYTADSRRYSLNLMPAGGGPPRSLFTSAAALGAPAWTPDGRAVVFEMSRGETGIGVLAAVFIATGERRQLTTPPAGTLGDVRPAVSPDGRTLAFCRKTGWRRGELHFLTLMPDLGPSGEPRRVTNVGYAGHPAWTPDGTRVLFEASAEEAGIWEVDRATGRAGPVVGPPQTAMQPALVRRPEGHTSLVFTNYTSDETIWRYGQGTETQPVELVSSSRSQNYPRYANNGKWLAFSSDRSGHQEIWIANADGSQPRQLTSLRRQLTEVGHWSPADDLIAFVSQGRGPRQLYTIDPAGGPAIPITNEEGVRSGNGWSRDGSAYYYTSSRSGRLEVWKVSRRGGAPQQMTRGGGISGFESSDGIFYYWRGEPGSYWRGHPGSAALLRRTPSGDEQVPLAPPGSPESGTDVAPAGFYYRALRGYDVYRYDERSGRSERLFQCPRQFLQFTVSPDGRWFAAGFVGKSGSDLMIMEHFR